MIAHSPFTVGRLPDRDLILEDVHVSRRHAEIVYENAAFHVVDLESRHGTFVNGIRVQQQRLSPQDLVHFGSVDGPALASRSRLDRTTWRPCEVSPKFISPPKCGSSRA